MKKILLSIILVVFGISTAKTDCSYTLENHIGWTIVDSKTIDGYIDQNGKRSDDFEGCDFDRTIVFTDGTAIRCNSFGYQYTFRPKAVILGKVITYKGKKVILYEMIVENEVYQMINF